jgi:hypothetical protein
MNWRNTLRYSALRAVLAAVARMERSAIRDRDAANKAPDFASLHPGYACYQFWIGEWASQGRFRAAGSDIVFLKSYATYYNCVRTHRASRVSALPSFV